MFFLAASVLLPVFKLKAVLAFDFQPSSVKIETKLICVYYFSPRAVFLLQFDVKGARHWMKHVMFHSSIGSKLCLNLTATVY